VIYKTLLTFNFGFGFGVDDWLVDLLLVVDGYEKMQIKQKKNCKNFLGEIRINADWVVFRVLFLFYFIF
jgi:hypothetical protein